MQNRVSAIPAVLTVEVELDSVSRGQIPPPALDSDAGEGLSWSIADDLRRVTGELERFGLVVLCGLYDTTELLRPGLPVADILMELYRQSLPDSRFQPRLMSICAHDDDFPIPEIAPLRRPGSGPLFLIPFIFLGDSDDIESLAERMEQTLLEKGRASVKTANLIQQGFGVNPVNLSYATINDLCALMKVQLEHNGFGGLWTLLESALFPANEPVRVHLDAGNLFLHHRGIVYTRHCGFAEWIQRFVDADNDQAEPGPDGYGRWQRIQRQYVAGLKAHGLTVLTVPSGAETLALETADPADAFGIAQQYALPPEADRTQQVVVDTGSLQQVASLSLTEHRLPELGPVAYTVLACDADDRILFMAHEYPLQPDAVRSIPGSWRAIGEQYGTALQEHQPGEILVAGDPPDLAPYPEDRTLQN